MTADLMSGPLTCSEVQDAVSSTLAAWKAVAAVAGSWAEAAMMCVTSSPTSAPSACAQPLRAVRSKRLACSGLHVAVSSMLLSERLWLHSLAAEPRQL